MKKQLNEEIHRIKDMMGKIMMEQVVSDFSKYPCVAKFRDGVSPKGEKSKIGGEGMFKGYQFYSNGRVFDPTTKTMYHYKCDPKGIVIGDVLDDLEIDV